MDMLNNQMVTNANYIWSMILPFLKMSGIVHFANC